jgi:hypothetical protein
MPQRTPVKEGSQINWGFRWGCRSLINARKRGSHHRLSRWDSTSAKSVDSRYCPSCSRREIVAASFGADWCILVHSGVFERTLAFESGLLIRRSLVRAQVEEPYSIRASA